MGEARRPRVVIIGAGFGGLNAARRLRRAPVDVTLLDRHNYHLFTPLLYEVATALLDPSEIAYPVRGVLHGASNVDFRVGAVERIDLDRKCVHTAEGEVEFDQLILAAGSVNNFFGNHSAEEKAFALKDLGESLAIRNQVLEAFEEAAWTQDPERRRRLLSFVIIGGGPSGVELAGAFHELIYLVLRKDYPRLDLAEVRVTLVEAVDHVLGAFPPSLRDTAARTLRRKRIELVFNAPVEEVADEEVRLRDGRVIPAATVIWTAGIQASSLSAQTGVELGRGGRVRVDEFLRLPGRRDVFVIGDMAESMHAGKPLPQLAGVALQQGKAVARIIAAEARGRQPKPFHYFDRGTMATIGRNAAVVDIRGLTLRGFVGWVTWLLVHLVLLVTFRSRVLVLINWAYDYFFYDRPVRLIVRADRER
ncbi:MAG TPA: NAD(P)/FAD-dependent oxidoreductase [Candidatus Dormibacteraeota bacterium]|nr:NAD(P)/FAD-dependent oxidoreductase [Candidatus Dormibacteraeota bacterium]